MLLAQGRVLRLLSNTPQMMGMDLLAVMVSTKVQSASQQQLL